jgi:hypothetical protein
MLLRKKAFLPTIIFMYMASVCAGSDTDSSRQTLKGLPSFSVLIEDFPVAVSELGLTTGQLQTDVELRLRKAGIRVVSSKEAPLPYLYVRVNGKRLDGSQVAAFEVHVGLSQLVSFPRMPGNAGLFEAETWSTGMLAIASKINTGKELRDIVADSVDKFANASQ